MSQFFKYVVKISTECFILNVGIKISKYKIPKIFSNQSVGSLISMKESDT